jgi:hypothetical protein
MRSFNPLAVAFAVDTVISVNRIFYRGLADGVNIVDADSLCLSDALKLALATSLNKPPPLAIFRTAEVSTGLKDVGIP